MAQAALAQRQYASFSQEAVDKIVEAAALAVVEARIPLAQAAFDETGRGVMEDKARSAAFSQRTHCALFMYLSDTAGH